MAIEKFTWSGDIKVERDTGRISGEYVLFARLFSQAYSQSFPNEMPIERAMRFMKRGLKILFWDE